MTCPNCGYILAPFEQSCSKCARLARTAQVSAIPGVGASQAHKVCPACGQRAVLTMAACGRCGYVYPPKPDRKGIVIAASGIAFGVVLVLIAVVASFGVGGRRGQSGQSINPEVGSGGTSPGLTSAFSRQVDSRLTRASATVGGELEISLVWNTLSDLDLEVRDPTGAKVDAYNPRSPSGGVQDVDANPTLLTTTGEMRALLGQNPGGENLLPIPEEFIDLDKKAELPGNFFTGGFPGLDGKAPAKFTRTPIEHIYYERAPRGAYSVFARCYSWREPNQTPLPMLIQVRSHGKIIMEVLATLGPSNYVADGIAPTEICRFTL